MKKFLIIFIFLGLVLGINAQNTTNDATVTYAQTYNYFTGAASDSIGVTDSIWTYTVRKKADAKTYMYYYIDLDSVGGTGADVYIIRQKKVFLAESYTTIDTITWAGSVDTTFSSLSSIQATEYWRIVVKGSTSSFNAKVNILNMKFLK